MFPTPKDLVAITQPINWKIIELSEIESNWQKNEDGNIEQMVSLTNEFGSVLILPTGSNFDSTALRVAYPSEGEVGLLFNYIDDENYSIYSLEKKDISSITGKLIGCTAGELSIIDSKDISLVPSELVIALVQIEKTLSIFIGENEVFKQDVESINFSTIGLYCNGNGPFQFMNLYQGNLESISEPIETAEFPFVPFELENEEKIEDKLNNYLSISPPKSETQVEFSEVFTVPLDSFYVSLYRNYGDVAIKLLGETEKVEEESRDEDLVKYNLDGDVFLTYDISPESFLVLGAKGINNMDHFKFPFDSIYTALVDKSTLEPIVEYISEITENVVKGILPLTPNHQLSIETALESALILIEDGSKLFDGKFPGGTQFSPSGNYALGNDYFKNELVLFNTSNGEIKSRLEINTSNGKTAFSLGRLEFSPDESILLGVFQADYRSDDKALIVVWATDTGEATEELFFAKNPSQIMFSNDSSRCLILVENSFEMYDTLKWEKVQQFLLQSHPINHPTFTPDSKYVVTYNYSAIEIWDADSGAFYKKYSQSINWAVPITNAEILFYQENQLRRWDFESDEIFIVDSIDIPHPYAVNSFGLSPDASMFFLLHEGVLDIFNSTDKTVVQTYSDMESVSEIVFSSDSAKIIIDGSSKNLKILHLEGSPTESPSIVIDNIDRAGCSSDGQTIFALDKSSNIHLIDSRTGLTRQSIETNAANTVSISQDGKHILVQEIIINTNQIDPETLENVKIPFDANLINNGVGVLAVSNDGSKLMYPGTNQVPRVWDFNSQTESAIFELQHTKFNEFQTFFSNDSERIIALTNNAYTITSFHISTQDRLNFNSDTRINCICEGMADDSMLSYHEDGTIHSWVNSTTDSSEIIFTDIEEDKGKYIGLSPSGEMLFILRDKRVSILSIPNGSLIQDIETGNEIMGFGIWFTPDNNGLAISSMNEVTVHSIKKIKTVAIPKINEELPSSYSYLLDYRPKRWYRQLKQAYDQEQHFNALAASFKTVTANLRTNMFTEPDPTIEDSPSLFTQINASLHQLNAYQGKEFEATSFVNEALDLQLALSSELRLNGYNLVYKEPAPSDQLYTYQNGKKRFFEGPLRIQEELTAKGYNFAIVGGRPKVKPFKPYLYDPNLDFSDNAKWKKLWAQLRVNIYNEDALTKEKEEAFEFQSKALFNIGVNTKIQTTQTKLDNDIQVAKEVLKDLDDDLDLVNEIIADWTADLEIIKSLTTGSFMNFYNELIIKEVKLKKLKNHFSLTDKSWIDTIPVKYTLGKWFFKYTITINYDRVNYRYAIEFTNLNDGNSKFYSAWSYGEKSHEYNTLSGLEISLFKQKIINIIQVAISEQEENKAVIDQKINKKKNEVRFHQDASEDLLANSLTEQRKKFIAYWNDPNQFGAFDTVQNEIMPEADPLADLLVSLQYPGDDEDLDYDAPIPLQELKWKTDYFKFSGNRFYNEEGHTLHSYLEFLKENKSKRVAIFPKMEDDGTINDDAFIAVINPQPALTMDDDLPVIKFVETYRIGIRWKGYSLGELSHTENLFPNETKEIKIERTIKLVRKQEEARTDSSTSIIKSSSSFEENLQKEVSLKETSSQEEENTTESSIKNTSKNEFENVKTDTKELSFDLKLDKIIPKIGGGIKGKNNSVNKRTDKREDTFEKSQKNTGKVANNESKEAFSKDTSNTIRKVANETSQENKVEIKVNSSEEFSSSTSRSEFINIENPNMGRTINYQFFQIQNGYEVSTTLIDVKVVVDMNREIIKGSTVTDVRVFDLEEMGKIFSDESEDPRYMLTAAIIARQAFKNYLSGVSGIARGNGALQIKKGFVPNMKLLEIVNFSRKLTKGTAEKDNMFEELREAMTYLKQVPFEFVETDINTPKEFYINAGSYYLDAEVGNMAATEQYLEDRRDIETQKQKSQVEHLNKKTEKGVFFPEIPDTVTHLNINDDLS